MAKRQRGKREKREGGLGRERGVGGWGGGADRQRERRQLCVCDVTPNPS